MSKTVSNGTDAAKLSEAVTQTDSPLADAIRYHADTLAAALVYLGDCIAADVPDEPDEPRHIQTL